MPNRIIKETIKTSEKIDKLTWFEEVVFYRLLVTADDFGHMDGRTMILKSELFPLKENVSRKSIEDAIAGLVNAALIVVYEKNGQRYVSIPGWDDHQNVRTKRQKYPAPDCYDLKQSEKLCNGLQKSATVCNSLQQTVTNCCSESESLSESLSESESESEVVCAERSDDHPAPQPEPPVFLLPLNDGSMFGVTQADLDRYSGLYPVVDVAQEMRKMIGWLEANPKRKKTKGGIRRFINNWLAGEQDRGGTKGGTTNAVNRRNPSGPERPPLPGEIVL